MASIDLISKKTNCTCSTLFFLMSKNTNLHVQHAFFLSLPLSVAQLQRCFVGLKRQTSQLHIIFMEELSYVLTQYFVSHVHVRFYFSLPLIFTLLAASISHCLTAALNFHVFVPTKFFSFVFDHSLQLFLSDNSEKDTTLLLFCTTTTLLCTAKTSNFLVTHCFLRGIVVCAYPIFCLLCSCSLLTFITAHFHLAGRQHFSFSHRRFEFPCFSS